MTADEQAGSQRISDSIRMHTMLEALLLPGGAQLCLLAEPEILYPVRIHSLTDDALLVDVSATPELRQPLDGGEPFALVGQYRGGALRTAPMQAGEPSLEQGTQTRLYRCAWPAHLEWLQRRETFRAVLSARMQVVVLARWPDGFCEGRLRDLSVQGCRVEFKAGALSSLEGASVSLAMQFPNGSRLVIEALARHRQVDAGRGLVRQGFAFSECTTEQERRLWYYVREIEREAARHSGNDRGRAASALFEVLETRAPQRAAGRPPQVPQLSRLMRVAAYVDSQILLLRDGGSIDPAALSRHAELLMALHREDRQALLFASHCLHQVPPLVGHCLAVAIGLLDMAEARGMPLAVSKALAAAALVHDLGKAMLAPALQNAGVLSVRQWRAQQEHVALLMGRLQHCGWMPEAVVAAVISGANERLDGSGYPRGLSGDSVPELARLAAVIDVMDAMCRPRGDRPARAIDTVYSHLLKSGAQFDPRWVREVITRFGMLPVGTLVRFANGLLARVWRLDAGARPLAVQCVHEEAATEVAGALIEGRDLLALGPAAAVPSDTLPGASE